MEEALQKEREMKITILNGNPKAGILDDYLHKLKTELERSKYFIDILDLRKMEIKYCSGCWGCWVKTPGLCVTKDDSYEVCKKSVNSDLLIFASPVIMGFTSALLKKSIDRIIPILHPYIMLVDNECHHKARYEKYPLTGLILDRKDADDEDIKIISDIYHRNAINLKTKLTFIALTSNSPKEVLSEINSI